MIVSRLPAERGLRVLDIGSGQGDLAADLVAARPDLDVAGVELSAVGVRLAAEKVPSGRFRQVDLLHDAELPDELRGWARVAICAEVLEHLDDPARFLQRARELMAPGCRVIITVPAGPRSAYDRHIGHRRHYDVADLTALLRAAGLRVEHVRAAGFPFFNVYKGLVILRGERLIQDADFGDRGESLPVRAVSAAFRVLFRLNASKTPWGWQLVALATAPD